MLAIDEEMELVKDNVKVIWENIGEGHFGDYDENDTEDENLLRFTVYVNEDNEWIQVDDSSYCTMVTADTDDDELMMLLHVLMEEFYDVLHDDIYASVKKLGERMSWIS